MASSKETLEEAAALGTLLRVVGGLLMLVGVVVGLVLTFNAHVGNGAATIGAGVLLGLNSFGVGTLLRLRSEHD